MRKTRRAFKAERSRLKREEMKRRREAKRRFGLTRRDLGAIGNRDMEPPEGYVTPAMARGEEPDNG